MNVVTSLLQRRRTLLICLLVVCLSSTAGAPLKSYVGHDSDAVPGRIRHLVSVLRGSTALALAQPTRHRSAEGLNGPLNAALAPARAVTGPGGAASLPVPVFEAGVAQTLLRAALPIRAPPNHCES